MIHLHRILTGHYWTKGKSIILIRRLDALKGLTCDVLELFLDLFPVHHVPPIVNVFGSLVVVLEIIRVLPDIES